MNHNYTAPSLAAEITMIDAAMAEMRNVHPPLTRSDCRRLIRAALAAAAPEARCTCPSGDGSLRWPCPDHPPRHQVDAVGVMTYGEAAAAIGINSAIRRIEAGDAGGAWHRCGVWRECSPPRLRRPPRHLQRMLTVGLSGRPRVLASRCACMAAARSLACQGRPAHTRSWMAMTGPQRCARRSRAPRRS